MPLRFLIDRWINRRARPSPEALARVAGLRPAVVVTGGSEGIGRALAERFAAKGRTVVLVARDARRLAAALASLPRPQDSFVLARDVTSSAAPAELEAELAARGLYVDILVNNAGIGAAGPFIDCDEVRLDQLVALNVTAVTRMTRHFLPQMMARGRGGILNVASLGGYGPGPYQAAYYASKAYVLSLTEALAEEAKGSGVRVCVVAPGPVETGFHAAMGADRALYRYLIPSLSATAVARSALRGFTWGQRVVVPGLVAKLLMLGARLAPHPILLPLLAPLLRPPVARRKR